MSELDAFTSVSYDLTYVGCIPIRVSIKSLNFPTRANITRECMHRVCEDVKLKVPTQRPNTKQIADYIGETTNKQWAMQSVRLRISLDGILVEDFHTGSILFHHRLPFISFASSGDADLMEFVNFVAKDEFTDSRQCYVFCCTNGCARDFISAIGQAFSIGYQGFKRSDMANQKCNGGSLALEHPTFGDSEPPLVPAPNIPIGYLPPSDAVSEPLRDYNGFSHSQAFFDVRSDESAFLLDNESLHDAWPSSVSHTPNLFIDTFNSPNLSQPVANLQEHGSQINTSRPSTQQAPLSASHSMEPLGEPWYLGKVSRQDAERLLQYDGDFLVRSSSNQNQPNQFVLSGLHNGHLRHLLLINPEGQVRTRDRIFNSIQELIDFHLSNGTPIRSADSELKLVFPVSGRG